MATPPVVPLLHADLGLSETAIGWLSSLPPLMFAIAAVPGALLIGRFGIVPTLVAGLLLNAVGGAARGAVADVPFLFASTIVMAAGVSIMQLSLPPLVRTWFPTRSGFATAVYTNGLLLGETFSVGLTIPLVLPLVDGSWRLNFVVWSIPVVLTALLVVVCTPGLGGGHNSRDHRQPARLARLAPPADLAARPDPRQRQRDVFRQQRVPARLPHRLRTARPDFERAHRASTCAGAVRLPDAGMAGRLVKEPWAYRVTGGARADQPDRHADDERAVDRVLGGRARLRHRGGADPGAGAAIGARRAGRRASHHGRHVHHQLQHRHDAVRRRRLAVGPHALAARRLAAGGAVRALIVALSSTVTQTDRSAESA